MAAFHRRIFTFSTFLAASREIFDHLEELRAAARSRRISRAFAEKIMVVVSQVNGCRYCSYGHARAALAAGVSSEELAKLQRIHFDGFSQEEVVALTFAQHFAESKGAVDLASWNRLIDQYGLDAARDIMAYLRMITFGNLYGNTFDAFLYRLKGMPAPGSNPFSEVGVILGALLILPCGVIYRLFGRAGRNDQGTAITTDAQPSSSPSTHES